MKKLLTVLSSLAFLVLPQWDVNGCVSYIEPESYRMFLLQPNITGKRHIGPLYFTTNYYFDFTASLEDMEDAAMEKNIDDWVKYLGGKYSPACVTKILYGTGASCLASKSCKDSIFINCPELKTLFENKNPTGEYIDYMHRALYTLTSWYDPWWWNDKTMDFANAKTLIKEGNKLLAKNKGDIFIKKRIALQLIRLHYYMGFYGGDAYTDQPKELLKVYTANFNPDTTTDWVDGSAYFYAACSGAMEGDRNYQLSLAYDRSDEKKFRCVELFARKELETTLTFAKNNRQKAVMYSMWLLQYPGRGLDKLQTIYELEPGYEDFDVLLSRELNKLEDWILTPLAAKSAPANAAAREDGENTYVWMEPQTYDSISSINLASDFEYLDNVIAFTQKIIDGKQQKQTAMWHLYLAHLYQLKKDAANADKQLTLAEAENKIEKNPRIATQLTIEWLMSHFLKADKLDETGKKLLSDFHSLVINENTTQLKIAELKILQYVGYLLCTKGQIAWGCMLINRSQMNDYGSNWWNGMGQYVNIYHFLAANGTDEDVETVIRILDKPNKTEFENYITKNIYYVPHEESSLPFLIIKDKLLDYYAKKYVQKDSLAKALSYLNRIDTNYWNLYPHTMFKNDDPFIVDLYDAHNYSKTDTRGYNFKQLVEGMLSLKNQLAKKTNKKDSLCYTLANAYYNISWHGKYWIAQEFYWSIHDYPPTQDDYNHTAPSTNPDYYSTQRAEYWYTQALRSTKNPTLGAACALMASQCRSNKVMYEEVIHHSSYDNIDWDELTNRPDEFEGEYRKRFKKDYYADMRDKCDTWQDFIVGWRTNGTDYKIPDRY